MVWWLTESSRQQWVYRLWVLSLLSFLIKLILTVVSIYLLFSLNISQEEFFDPSPTMQFLLISSVVGSLILVVIQLTVGLNLLMLQSQNSRRRRDGVRFGTFLHNVMVFACLVEVILVVWTLSSLKSLEQGFEEGLRKHMNAFRGDRSFTPFILNRIEEDFKCCAVHGPHEYEGETTRSCCRINTNKNTQCISNVSPPENFNQRGCLPFLTNSFLGVLITCGVLSAVALLMDVLTLGFFKILLSSMQYAIKKNDLFGAGAGVMFGTPPKTSRTEPTTTTDMTAKTDFLPLRTPSTAKSSSQMIKTEEVTPQGPEKAFQHPSPTQKDMKTPEKLRQETVRGKKSLPHVAFPPSLSHPSPSRPSHPFIHPSVPPSSSRQGPPTFLSPRATEVSGVTEQPLGIQPTAGRYQTRYFIIKEIR